MSPTAALTRRGPLRALSCTAIVVLMGALAGFASPAEAAKFASSPAGPAKLSAKQLSKVKPPAKLRLRGTLQRHPRLRAAAYSHPVGTGSLLCEPNRSMISVGPVTSTVNSGETLYTRASLFRWTTNGWVLDVVGRTVQTRDRYVVHTTHWFRPNGVFDPDGSSQAFNIGLRGRYYAIARDMWWLDARGNVVDRHYAWATQFSGSYYCYI